MKTEFEKKRLPCRKHICHGNVLVMLEYIFYNKNYYKKYSNKSLFYSGKCYSVNYKLNSILFLKTAKNFVKYKPKFFTRIF